MLLYLFVLNGQPTARTELHRAQAALEDHLRDRRDVSDVWWSDENPYIPRVYLYGGSHSDYEANEAVGVDAMEGDISWEEHDQLIWPMELPEAPTNPINILDPAGARMSLSIVTREGKREYDRVIPEEQWSKGIVEHNVLLMSFALDAAYGLSGPLYPKKEGS